MPGLMVEEASAMDPCHDVDFTILAVDGLKHNDGLFA